MKAAVIVAVLLAVYAVLATPSVAAPIRSDSSESIAQKLIFGDSIELTEDKRK